MRDRLRRPIEAVAQVDAAVVAEGWDGLAGEPVESIEKIAIREKEAVLINRDAAMAKAALRIRGLGRIEGPDLAAGLGIERDHPHFGSGRVKQAADNDRVALHLRVLEGVVGVVGPGDPESRDVGGADLRKGRVADVVGSAIDGPVDIGRLRGDRETQKKPSHAFAFYPNRGPLVSM